MQAAESDRGTADALQVLSRGTVIPAHPLALTASRELDVVHQRALTRYYLDAGAGGLAVGVHITQFRIREHGLYAPLLELTAQEAGDWTSRAVALIAGVTGPTGQAVQEARTARALGYTAVIVNVAAFRGLDESEALRHCRLVAREMPIVGFALAPELGGVHLSYGFWREFAAIDNVLAIKIATFDRYRALDVIRGVVDAGAQDRIALYTGNDDNIVADLVTPVTVRGVNGEVTVRFRGGLLGHWSVWTARAVELHRQATTPDADQGRTAELLRLGSRVTDCNSAIFDAHNAFAGCIPGCLEVLRRQGLVDGAWCLDEDLVMSEGQREEIDRVYREHPDLSDDEFVQENLDRWLTRDTAHATRP
ncbi:dihydrodipicolinate synthase family protein [Amycolatopsis rhabdoformis]|uniref:Dihydrodipicolinate synthase family protein n=1 Tax=Amycolatopsis rhabdoformis TaxID=1448059 RepID=A0ABZ1ILH2_9PSEU|nr:dihydrodipicolinate synthase family protein [Amycolatopsis rhabdoformis]WSE34577.1 dihydrodipicolinate synthase family protein [Amycolatopsis rhabdoformis]